MHQKEWEAVYAYRFSTLSVDAMESRVRLYMGNWKEAYDAAERILVQKSTLEDLNDPEAKLPNNYTSAEMITAYEFFNDDVTSASILIPVRVDPTFTELQTRSVFAIACGIDSIRSLSAGVIPLLTSAE